MAGSKPYRVHPQAWLEIEAATDWYQQRSVDASVGFIAAVFDGLEKISRTPQRWPEYLFGARRFVVQRFPFFIIYLDDADAVNVIAVAHNKRRPGYWKQRL
jgi:toxin ParE1/3/4